MTTSTRNQSIASMTDAELIAERDHLTGLLGLAFKQMGPNYDAGMITVLNGDTASKSQQVKALNDRLTEVKSILSQLVGTPIYPENGDGIRRSGKSLGALITESRAIETRHMDFEIAGFDAKTLFETGAGWAPEVSRSNVVALNPQREPAFAEILPVVNVTSGGYSYMRETTFTNNAVEKGEGVTFGEAALALTEVEEPVRKVPVYLPFTDEQLSDVPGAREYLDSRLAFMILQRLDSQLLVGDGTAPNISGFLDRTNINTQAKGADPVFDAIQKAMGKVRTVGFAEPDTIVMHPNDWEAVRLTRTTDGIYIMGSPAAAGAPTLFGKRVIVTSAITENTALVGAFGQHSALVLRSGIEVKISDSHAEYFTAGKQVIRAQVRAGLAVFREEAFCEVTGL